MICKFNTCGTCFNCYSKHFNKDCFPCEDADLMTNADRIRAMSDEELNKLFHEIYNAGAEDAFAYELGQRTNSFEWTMEWLKQSAE